MAVINGIKVRKSNSVGSRIYDGRTPSEEVQGEAGLFKDLDSLILTGDERSRIIESAVPMVEEHLKQHTPYLEGEDVMSKTLYGKKIGHIRDNITHKPHEWPDGGTSIGWPKRYAPIARWVNWGTYRQAPQFFFETAFSSMDWNLVFNTMRKEADKVIAEKRAKP